MDDHLLTRLTLLDRARGGQESMAWQEIWDLYEPFVHKILLYLKVPSAHFDDILQKVFIKLWKGLSSYDEQLKRAKFRTWFSRLIRNVVIDDYREKKNERKNISIEGTEMDICSDSNLVEQMIEEEWQKHIVGLAMVEVKKAFSGKALEVFEMGMQGKSSEEIEKELGVKASSQYVMRNRVKKRFKSEIQELRSQLEDL
jgi:RNA polymerase sigma factor (sigma-70 family)